MPLGHSKSNFLPDNGLRLRAIGAAALTSAFASAAFDLGRLEAYWHTNEFGKAEKLIVAGSIEAIANTKEAGSVVFSLAANAADSVTIFDGVATTVFTFQASGNGAVGAAVDVAFGASATDSATNLRAAINANTNINVTGTGAGTTVTVTNDNYFGGSITKVDADNDYAVTDFTAGGETYTFKLEVDDNEAFSSAKSVATILIAGLNAFAGTPFELELSRESLALVDSAAKWLRLTMTPTEATASIQFWAFIKPCGY